MAVELKVKTLQGKQWTIKAETTDTIATLKKRLEDAEAGPVEAQRLIFGGKILEDNKSVNDYGLSTPGADGAAPAPMFLVINPEAAKKAEEAKKAREAAKAAEDAKKAEEAKKNDPALIAKQVEAVSKKLAATKTIHELLRVMEAELATLKKPAGAGAAAAPAAAKPATEWSCAACTSVNKPGRSRCEVCDTPNPNAPKPGGAGAGAGANEPWVCGTCTFNNRGGSRKCGMCDTANPAAPPAPPAVGRVESDAGDFGQGGDN